MPHTEAECRRQRLERLAEQCVDPEQQCSILYRLNPAHRRKLLMIACGGSAAVKLHCNWWQSTA